MIYTHNNLILIEDIKDNLYLFKLREGIIFSYGFQGKDNKIQEKKISNRASLEYDISIDNKNNIYIVYQDKNFHLVLLIKSGESIREIILTEEPLPEIINLSLEIIEDITHIFYNVLVEEKKYRIVHHYYNNSIWKTNLVEDIKINQVLNPMKILYNGEKLFLIYYNLENIYCKCFNINKGQWEEKIKITENPKDKLYLDCLIIDGKLHLSYCDMMRNY